MFSASVQPSVVSLFSSTGSDPLALFSSHCDTSLPSDSFVCILNDSTSEPAPPAPRTLIEVKDADDDDNSPDYALGQSVLHIQSPTLRTTYIRCPPAGPSSTTQSRRAPEHLGLKHPWMHLQVRNLHREWAFEVGLVDQSGREGIVRCATFQWPYVNVASSAGSALQASESERTEIEARTQPHVTLTPLIPSAIHASTHVVVHDGNTPPIAPAALLISCSDPQTRRRGFLAGGT
ncbi:hypothetical protein ONZ51_g87 [Trametes cubensis]|uniref:CFA20 domain-containing protein n=1 Tax=Trametes cubensis TaxID=1111947 RepID=A0AAD7U4U7_9APHY|nr:hypothetical protein ONZ51_g87 [Trametes cubensis]